ncbi:AAA family ATPase [Arthrobacter sp. ISL-48]|uniref:AAA family ATPase n=1 Tax=Arthrobacter sp. ISL-48 TaxID=2819110 RepID=UPI001BE5DDFB|nr:AAA family ATPase [Arthrobacter sp. ISL-48]MBT2533231.1 AAA family ATPase [Arthrobacter sp. ISL-48]
MSPTDFVIFLNGTYGAGKTSTLDHIGDLLSQAQKPFSLMDVDWFHRSWPPSKDDPTNTDTEAANMAAVWRNYKNTGARQLVVSGVMASLQDRTRYEAIFELPVRPIRLTATEEETEKRLRRRYTPEQDSSLQWHLKRYRQLNSTLTAAGLDEAIIETTQRKPGQVARDVLEHFAI